MRADFVRHRQEGEQGVHPHPGAGLLQALGDLCAAPCEIRRAHRPEERLHRLAHFGLVHGTVIRFTRGVAQVQSDQPGQPDAWDVVRGSIIGGNAFLDTPFGRRRLSVSDHTASGRAVTLIEDQLRSALELYGNTHTEDDATGSTTSERLRDAEA